MTGARVPVPTGADQLDVDRVMFDALDHYLDVLVAQMVEDADEQAQADATLAEHVLGLFQARLNEA